VNLSASPRALFWRLRAREPERLLYRARRAALVARTRVHAAWHRADIELDISPDVRLGRHLRIVLFPRTSNVVRIGPGALLDDRILMRMNGGKILLGPATQLRSDVVLNVGGRLELAGSNILSWGCAVHCADSVRLDALASAAEHVTIADSTHYFTEPGAFFYENTRTAPVVIGGNTWLCPKATVTSGVTVGQHCIIASNSVVIHDVPDGHLASGIPATNKALELPWQAAHG